MTSKVSTCLYVDREVIKTAKKVGLNISKVSENALVEAISELTGTVPRTSLASPPPGYREGRDLNPGARLHRPIGYQTTTRL
jgi:hypothetical protein